MTLHIFKNIILYCNITCYVGFYSKFRIKITCSDTLPTINVISVCLKESLHNKGIITLNSYCVYVKEIWNVNCAVLSHSVILPAATDYLKPICKLNFFSSVVINVPWYLFLKHCCFFLFFAASWSIVNIHWDSNQQNRGSTNLGLPVG